MALPTISLINGKKVAQVANALYGVVVGKTTNDAVLVDIVTYGFDATVNSYYDYSFGSMTANDVATIMAANMGITAASVGGQVNVDSAIVYIESVITTAAAGTEGAALSSMLDLWASMASDPIFGTAATAWNTAIANAMVYTASGTTADVAIANATAGATLALTTGADVFAGTAGDDTYNAYIIDNANTLQSGDVINGGAGNDTLYADIGTSQAFAISAQTSGVETVQIRAQSSSTDVAGNNVTTAQTVQVDAERMSGVTHWESNNSRADVIIEHVTTGGAATKDVTIAMVETDPGDVDFGVYFDQLSLRNAGTSTSTLNLQVMDTVSVVAGTAPLLNIPFDGFTFFADGVSITLGGAANAADAAAIGAAQTYAELAAAFQAAADTLLGAGTVAVTVGTNFTVSDTASGTLVTGQHITMTASGTVTITTPLGSGWSSTGVMPASSGTHTALISGSGGTTELVASTIILDDVGRGSTGGDLLVGGMSTGETSSSRGVERFEIEVRDNSKLQTINSTNNALREVVITNGATSGDNNAYTNTTANAGNLSVNGKAGLDGALAGVNNGVTVTHDAAGFTDVRLIDASAMTGKFSFTAAVTVDSINKYVNLVDTATSPTADVAGSGNVNFDVPGANFAYTGGSNNDTMNVTIDGAVAASSSNVVTGQSDFTFAIDGGAGNDAITLSLNTLTGGAQDWYDNQANNDNVRVTGGAGNDTIRTIGAGDIIIDAGAGDDTIYTDNSASVINPWVTAGAAATNNAVWVFNATGAAGRLLTDVESSTNTTYGMFGSTITVTFRGLTSAAVTVANTSYKSSDLQINQAIKNAINNDAVLSKLLIAEDGPGNTLVVTSLTDGVRAATGLNVAMTASTTTVSAADIAGYVAVFTTVASTSAAVLADMATNATTFNGAAEYNSAFAMDTTATAITGVNSTTTSDNTITGGTDNDIIVLGTTDSAASAAAASNEILVYSAAFGNDTVLNFGLNVTGVAAVTETATFTPVALTTVGDTVVINGLTITAGAGCTAANVELALETGATAGAAVVSGAYAAAWTVGVGAAGTVVYTSATAGANVADLANTGATTVPADTMAAPAIVQGVAAVTAAFGGDQFNFNGLNGDITTQGDLTTLVVTNKSINVVVEVDNGDTILDAGENWSDAGVKAILDAGATDDAIASNHVFIVYDAANVASVYTAADGTGNGDVTVTLVGTIDLADTAWSTLTTANFL